MTNSTILWKKQVGRIQMEARIFEDGYVHVTGGIVVQGTMAYDPRLREKHEGRIDIDQEAQDGVMRQIADQIDNLYYEMMAWRMHQERKLWDRSNSGSYGLSATQVDQFNERIDRMFGPRGEGGSKPE